MKISLTRRLGAFERRLSKIIGADLARDLVMYAQSPSPLEARMLREDGIHKISKQVRERTVKLIAEFEE